VTLSQLFTLLRKSAVAWHDDDCSSMGAALAFYTLFSIAPLLLIVIGVGSLILGRTAAREQILGQVGTLMGEAGQQAVAHLLTSANSATTSLFAAIAGTILLLFGATAVFTEVYGNFNRIWGTPSPLKATGIRQLIQTRILSFAMILGIGFLILMSLVVSSGLAAAGDWWGIRFLGWPLVGAAVGLIANVATYTLAFAMIYKFLPQAHIHWHDVWTGAAVTAVLFEIGKGLIGLYFATSVTSVFGAAGSLVVLLVWLYYSAQVFLLGAEFTKVYTHRRGSQSGKK
jgi:membrane protein